MSKLFALVLSVAVCIAVLGNSFFKSRSLNESNPLTKLAEIMVDAPTELADWESTPTPLSDKEFARTNCIEYDSRTFKNIETGEEVSVYVAVGTARHVTIDSPDWWYSGVGFQLVAKPSHETLSFNDSDGGFLAGRFHKRSDEGNITLRMFWSFYHDGCWAAPDRPKSYFAGEAALIKVYLIAEDRSPYSAASEVALDDTIAQFAKEYMPLLNLALFPTPQR